MGDPTITELGSLIKDFKAVNDEILTKQDSQGQGVAELKAQQTKIEERIDMVEAGMNKKFIQAKADENTSKIFGGGESLRYLEATKHLRTDEFKTAWMECLTKGPSVDPIYTKTVRELISKTMIVADDTTGGIWAPPEFVNIIIKDIVEIAPWRALVNVRNTTNRSIMMVKRLKTALAKRIAETGTQDPTGDPQYGTIEIPAHKVYARADISDEDIQDPAMNIETLLREEWAEQFGLLEAEEGINGTGTGEAQGILDPSAALPNLTALNASSGADDFDADDLIKLVSSVKSGYWNNLTFLLKRDTIGAVRRLKDTSGRYLWDMGQNSSPSGLAQKAPMTILGHPVVEVPQMPALASGKKCIALGDWKKCYTMVDRINLSILRDVYTSAGNGIVRIFARKRNGGQVVQPEAGISLTLA